MNDWTIFMRQNRLAGHPGEVRGGEVRPGTTKKNFAVALVRRT